jgi:hypothetical protein
MTPDDRMNDHTDIRWIRQTLERIEGRINGLPCSERGDRLAKLETGVAWAKGLGIGTLICIVGVILKVWLS